MATKFITVSIDIMHDKNLSPNQKFILAEIYQLSQLDKGCVASNRHFSELVGITTMGVSKSINDLSLKGYISIDNAQTKRNFGRVITINSGKSDINSGKSDINSGLQSKENKTNNKTNNKTMNKNKENLDYSFDDYWSLVPNKKNSGQAKATFNKLRKSNILPTSINEMQKGLIYENIKMLFKYKYQQNPSTWLNSENWSQSYTKDTLYDEITSMYSDFEVKMLIKEKIESIFEEYEL